MTLTLSPEIERLLNKAAQQQGRTPEELAEQTLREKYALPEESHEEKKARIQEIMGSMAYLGPSRITEDRAEEVAREEREERRQEALARIRSGYYQSRLSSTEDYMARKAEEKALEERHWCK